MIKYKIIIDISERIDDNRTIIRQANQKNVIYFTIGIF